MCYDCFWNISLYDAPGQTVCYGRLAYAGITCDEGVGIAVKALVTAKLAKQNCIALASFDSANHVSVEDGA